MEFREVTGELEIETCAEVIRKSFRTVADEFGLTEENAPTNPAFLTVEKLRQAIAKPVRFFGLFDGTRQVGCVALERSHDEAGVFFLERLSVVPEERRNGYGAALMDHACREAKKAGAEKIKIGIIDENRVLKRWYLDYGFTETGTKTFAHLPFTVCFMEKNIAS
ncbi:MAG: GNAT family N-acetyltransferase [Spirochaetales bacterium]|nr:GNAT family N-acetyltransferase [Spirochaetales bacterium]